MDHVERLSNVEQKRQEILDDLVNLRRQVAKMSPGAVQRWAGLLEEAGMTQGEAQRYVRGIVQGEPAVAPKDPVPDRGQLEEEEPGSLPRRHAPR